MKKNCTITAKEVYRDSNLNTHHADYSTIARILRKTGLLASNFVCQSISTANQTRRLLFARKYVDKSSEFSKKSCFPTNLIFFQRNVEKNFRIFQVEALYSDHTPRSCKEPRKIKVWGSIGFYGVDPLIQYSRTINKEKYLELLKTYLLQAYTGLKVSSTRGRSLIWPQDNAPPHRAIVVRNWFEENNVKKLDWPAMSPDLNIIENIWAYIKEELWKVKSTLKTKEDVWEKVQKILYEEINSMLPRLYLSFPRRLREVIEIDGKRVGK